MEVNPATWSSPGLPLLVVGAVDNHGYIPDFVQYQPTPLFPDAKVDVFAPGVNIFCDGPLSGREGTSQGRVRIRIETELG